MKNVSRYADLHFTDAKLRKKFRFLLKLAGLKFRAPKQFRHTFATLAIGSGENIQWVAKNMGHANEQITLRRYSRFVKNLTHRDGSLLVKDMASDRLKSHSEATRFSK
ncbi:MAG: hypothetical protein CVU57_29955 [Deltaproteobacteria bacterium HGW-Deltaproteobacteria-15]|jgi:integrase|nr:MAG: hypothetical protein CVU57_29955 [Deltaproteobacteria bacterium HGW-Deltaproteobacteria-15]